MPLAYGSTECRSTLHHVNGIDLHVVEAGEGPPVLLVHGFPDTHSVWRNQIPALVTAGFRVIAPDTRGCGESQLLPSESDYKIEHLVQDLVALLDVLGLEKVRLVGHDWGAVTSWAFVARHPERVECFIPLSVGHPRAYAKGGLRQKLLAYYVFLIQLRGFTEWFCRLFGWLPLRIMTGYPARMAEWKERYARPGRLTAGMNYYRANFLAMLFKSPGFRVPVPVYAMWSTGDRFLLESQMTGSRAFVDGPWDYTRIEGANHWLQLDTPGQVTPRLLDYLNRPASSAPRP
jgi:pimeloyl-ACP methyl ester carboxylesterase